MVFDLEKQKYEELSAHPTIYKIVPIGMCQTTKNQPFVTEKFVKIPQNL